jgi:hypothetical protein
MDMKRGLGMNVSCVLAAMLMVSCSRAEPGGGDSTDSVKPSVWTVRVEALPSPAGAGSSAPQLTVSERGVILSWIERSERSTYTLKFAERNASGWTSPTTVASGNNWVVSDADPPVVLRRRDGTLVANWLVSTNRKLEGSDLHLTHSNDNGKTWAPSFMPHHDGTQGQHAFPSFFEMPGGVFGLVWLDARAQAANPEDLDASMSLRYAAFDRSWKQTADATVDTRVCECCSTTAAVTEAGVLAAFRDRTEKEIRDIVVSSFDNGSWTDTRPVHNDNWEIDACPVNGPALSAQGREAIAAWFTVKNDRGQAWAAFSSDAGRTWGHPVRLDDGQSLGRVDVDLLDDGSAAATWIELVDDRGQLRLRRIEPSGIKSAPVTIADLPGSSMSSFPHMASRGGELVFAWTERARGDDAAGESGLVVRTAAGRLPGIR